MPHSRPRAHAVMDVDAFELLFDETRRERFASLADVAGRMLITDLDDPAHAALLAETEVLVSSWGMPQLDAERLSRMPKLRAVLHAAGSVQHIVSEEFWARGIRLTSAADANAVPVAEFTLGAILLSGKRTFTHLQTPHDATWNAWTARRIGNVDRTVGIVGFSRIGRRVVELLRPFDGIRTLVSDPFADPDAVAAAGGILLSVDEMLPQVDVLSLHAPALPATRHMIAAPQLAALPDGATLINTARGALLDHDALLAECRTGRLEALLDVTEPEPLPADHPLRALPNVAITPHLAGSLGTEARRLADSALAELAAYIAGAPATHPVTQAELEISA
ncbi:hydroxyacid dehydrogenase [Microbacterium esteraromaticum]|uniref:hydroxyacid dehydrogenase n=1 Tax=Microbacterium esteraromaticum TaxID=57043 RepID=UPI0019583BEC|nr:hydroxyacid dehydrogenase [Microbacterium esteraromaticum]MBM7465596.1 phosphoglycerate dehydrogenase-like enzyme [Microbacterium esteraromaticum]